MGERFVTRWGLLAAALGMAIGTGNIWRFPRVCAQNGGGAFLIPWFIFLLLWSIPLLAAEFTIGQRTRKGLFGAFAQAAGRSAGWLGGLVAMTTFLILSYYAVVTGWCLSYIVKSLFSWQAMTADATAVWEQFSTDPLWKIAFQAAAVLLTAGVVTMGVVRGVEKINKLLIPSIVVLIVILAVKAVSLPGSEIGLKYLFVPDFSYLLKPRTWLEALSQSAWSTGAGWGLMLVYATYASRKESARFVVLTTGIGNNLASIIAATAIVPTIFALLPADEAMKIIKGGNQGLAFISLPGLMAKMGGGQVFSTLFFTALFFAAFSSLISMFEMGVRTLADFSMGRKKAVAVVSIFAFLAGLPSALSMKFFNNQDWVWGLGLIVSGLFFSIALWKSGFSRFFGKSTDAGKGLFQIWAKVAVAFLVPVMFVLILGWWFYGAIKDDPAGWWHPVRQYSVGTCIVQWVILLAALFVLWKKFIEKKCC